MKRFRTGLMLFLLLLGAAGAASAKAGYTFAIKAEGEGTGEICVGDRVQVSLEILCPEGGFSLYGFQDYLCFDPLYWAFEEGSLETMEDAEASFHEEESRVFVNRGSTTAVPTASGKAMVTFRLVALRSGSTSIISRGQELLSRDAKEIRVDLQDSTVTIRDGSGGTSPLPPAEETEPAETAFHDVPPGAWYRESVAYCTRHGLMDGTGEGRFSPDSTTSREMLVTMLFRMEGEPQTAEGPAFSDVVPDRWYTDAVRWAASVGIVLGYGDGRFGTGEAITREQLAVFLYRCARRHGLTYSADGALARFRDREEISPYAVEAVSWAAGAGILGGMGDDTIAPGGPATRAQTAAMLHRFCMMLEK